jgi:hypothetical protein
MDTLSGASHRVRPSWVPKAYQKPWSVPPTDSMYDWAAEPRQIQRHRPSSRPGTRCESTSGVAVSPAERGSTHRSTRGLPPAGRPSPAPQPAQPAGTTERLIAHLTPRNSLRGTSSEAARVAACSGAERRPPRLTAVSSAAAGVDERTRDRTLRDPGREVELAPARRGSGWPAPMGRFSVWCSQRE